MRLLIFISMMTCIPSLYAEQFACISTEIHGDSKGDVQQYLLKKDQDNYILHHLWSGADFNYTAIDTGKHLHLANERRNDALNSFESNNILLAKSSTSLEGLQSILITNLGDKPLAVLAFELECHMIR
jgi:hypothetical protein